MLNDTRGPSMMIIGILSSIIRIIIDFKWRDSISEITSQRPWRHLINTMYEIIKRGSSIIDEFKQ